MLNIYGLTRKQLEDYFESIGEKKFKAQQVFEWLYQKKESDFDKFSNIKKDVIEKLKNDFTNNKIKIIRKQSSTDTYKYLFELEDKNYIEAVVMVHN